MVGGVVFSDYRVSPNLLVVLGLRLLLRLGLGCDNISQTLKNKGDDFQFDSDTSKHPKSFKHSWFVNYND